LQGVDRLAKHRKGLCRCFCQPSAILRQSDIARGAVEQFEPKLVFEAPDVVADCGGGYGQGIGGPSKAAALGCGVKCPQCGK